MNEKIVKKILDAAVMAPSGDNVQPWEFKVLGNYTKINLYNLPEKDNSYYNFNQSASYIAHGAVIENIVISAGHLGCQAQVNLFPNKNELNLVATIELIEAIPKDDLLYPMIFKRCTNRFQFKQKNITEDMIDSLSSIIKKNDNTNISLVYEKDKINELAKELMVNDRLVFERKDIHHFLFDKIRWNKKEIEETLDGMPVDTLGLSFVEKLTFPLMRFWWVVKIANYFGLSRIIGLKCWWNCRTASMLGMLSVKGNDKYAFVQGGRAVQRVWLESALLGLSLQPIIGLPLLINRLNQNGLNGFLEGQQKLVERSAEMLPRLFSIDKNGTMVMGFRLGQGQENITKTLRRQQ